MLKITDDTFENLKRLQPELDCSSDRVWGRFDLSASFDPKNKKGHPFQCLLPSGEGVPNFICEFFSISVTFEFEGGGYLNLVVKETSGKLFSWKENIPPEYWHINPDDSLCLGTREELQELQEKSQSFEEYFVSIISQFLYHMTYIRRKGREPWDGDRHGVFRALGIAYRCDGITPSIHRAILINLASDWASWKSLLSAVVPHIIGGRLKIRNDKNCPFCFLNKKIKNRQAGKCRIHKSEIRGFNRISERLFFFNLNNAKFMVEGVRSSFIL